MDRSKTVFRTSFLGIAANLFLVAFKSVIGLISGSIAIILDAVNNLSDILSSLITIIGTKLACKAPDKKHPYGHGRFEYIASLAIAMVVVFAGITSMIEAVKRIIQPAETSYVPVMLVFLVLGIGVKLAVGLYFRAVGKKIRSGALTASGTDALFDAVLAAGTLIAAVISMIWGLSLEGWFGAVISVFILRAGFKMILENVDSIVGTRADSQTVNDLRSLIESYPEVRGAYDIVLHNYGPTSVIASAHMEVDGDMTALEIHRLSRVITADVYQKLGIVLTLGIYASRPEDPFISDVQKTISDLAGSEKDVLQVHGIFVDPEAKAITFDIVVDFRGNGQEIRSRVRDRLLEKYPGYSVSIVLDSDYGES